MAFSAFLKALAVLGEGDFLQYLDSEEGPNLEGHAVPQVCMDIFSDVEIASSACQRSRSYHIWSVALHFSSETQ